MTIPEVQNRLKLAFPKSDYIQLWRAVQEGSYLADHLYDGESFLNNHVGRDLRGHVRRIGIAHQIERYCGRGDLPYVTQMKPMPKGRWHWLEIKSAGAIAHVCRTEDVYTFPHEAVSRQDVRLALQPDLLSWSSKNKTLETIVKEIPDIYAWLTFRVGQDGLVSHLCWASPAPDADEWLGHINILHEVAAIGSVPDVSTTPDPKEKLRLKEHVAHALEKSDEKQGGE